MFRICITCLFPSVLLLYSDKRNSRWNFNRFPSYRPSIMLSSFLSSFLLSFLLLISKKLCAMFLPFLYPVLAYSSILPLSNSHRFVCPSCCNSSPLVPTYPLLQNELSKYSWPLPASISRLSHSTTFSLAVRFSRQFHNYTFTGRSSSTANALKLSCCAKLS